MPWIYGIYFIASLAVIGVCLFLFNKKKATPFLLGLLTSISITILGNHLISVSDTVSFAIFGNNMAYPGQMGIMICTFFLILHLCGHRSPLWLSLLVASAP